MESLRTGDSSGPDGGSTGNDDGEVERDDRCSCHGGPYLGRGRRGFGWSYLLGSKDSCGVHGFGGGKGLRSSGAFGGIG